VSDLKRQARDFGSTMTSPFQDVTREPVSPCYLGQTLHIESDFQGDLSAKIFKNVNPTWNLSASILYVGIFSRYFLGPGFQVHFCNDSLMDSRPIVLAKGEVGLRLPKYLITSYRMN